MNSSGNFNIGFNFKTSYLLCLLIIKLFQKPENLMIKELWISTKTQRMDSRQLGKIFLKENKIFWIYIIIIVTFILFLPALSGVDVGLGILLLVLGGSHFLIQFNQINIRYNQFWGFDQNGYFQVDRKHKRTEIPWNNIISYTFDPEAEPSLRLTILKKIQLAGKIRSFEEKILLSPEKDQDTLLKILDTHIS